MPLPSRVLALFITFFQYGSAEVVDMLLQVTGMNYIREGLTFHLPSISIFIAKECSGIRSSTALVITAVLAGHLMLKTVPGKIMLMIAVAPFTLLKNGIRITTLTVLAEKVDTKWLTDSTLHHRGGIVFFGIILFFLLGVLQVIRKTEVYISERKERKRAAGTS
jgi:exosortase